MRFSKLLLKRFLRWGIWGAVLFFLARVLQTHWQGIANLRIEASGWACLTISLGFTLLAHLTAGWVWSRILRNDFRQAVQTGWIIQAYLQTNIAKYLPGNIWHYYGRIAAAQKAGATLEAATVSVLLEPLLMASAALIVALLSSQVLATQYGWGILFVQWVLLGLTLWLIHPRVLNWVLQRLARLKQKNATATIAPATLTHYPLLALCGNLAFLLLRGVGFLFAFWAISIFDLHQVFVLLSAFSIAWLLGLIVPGAPGGIGIFEAAAIALLGSLFSPGTLIAVVALYRLVSVLSEAIGSLLAWFDQKLTSP